jgi:hypothetical protein
VSRNASKLNIKQKWQNTCMGTSQTIPSLAKQTKIETGRSHWLLQTHQAINQGHVGEDQQIARGRSTTKHQGLGLNSNSGRNHRRHIFNSS